MTNNKVNLSWEILENKETKFSIQLNILIINPVLQKIIFHEGLKDFAFRHSYQKVQLLSVSGNQSLKSSITYNITLSDNNITTKYFIPVVGNDYSPKTMKILTTSILEHYEDNNFLIDFISVYQISYDCFPSSEPIPECYIFSKFTEKL